MPPTNHCLLAFLFLVLLSVRSLMLVRVLFPHSLAILLSVLHPNSKRVSLYHHSPIIMVIQYHPSFISLSTTIALFFFFSLVTVCPVSYHFPSFCFILWWLLVCRLILMLNKVFRTCGFSFFQIPYQIIHSISKWVSPLMSISVSD